MKKWTEYLSEEVFNRLCGCCNRKADIPELMEAKWKSYVEVGKDKDGFTKEDALIAVLEHLDCNSQDIELTIDEYHELLGKV